MKFKLFFKPLLWPTVFTVISLSILISLGTWQIKRLIWKQNLINFYLNQFENKVINLNQENYLNEEMQFRQIVAKGKFLNKSEIQITGKTYEGNAGFHVITPFEMENGQIILANRGWVSEKYKLPDARKFSLIDKIVTIKGIVRLPQKKGYFVPINNPKKNFWITIKPDEIKKYLKINKENFITSFYIDLLRDGKKIVLPIAVKPQVNLRNQHLSYAITWYSLSISLLIVYFLYHFSEGRLVIRKINNV